MQPPSSNGKQEVLKLLLPSSLLLIVDFQPALLHGLTEAAMMNFHNVRSSAARLYETAQSVAITRLWLDAWNKGE
jgi:hypothetical protein